jgi:hypothetical protein
MLRQMAGVFGADRRETYNCHSPFVPWQILNYGLIYAKVCIHATQSSRDTAAITYLQQPLWDINFQPSMCLSGYSPPRGPTPVKCRSRYVIKLRRLSSF